MHLRNFWLTLAGVGGFVLLAAFVWVHGTFVSWFLFYFYATLAFFEGVGRFVSLRGLAVERQVSATRVGVGDRITVTVSLRRTGPWAMLWPLLWVRVHDNVTDDWSQYVRPGTLFAQPMWLRHWTLNYTFEAPARGMYALGDIAVETGDLLGLMRWRRTFPGMDKVLVYPQTTRVVGWQGAVSRQFGQQQGTGRRFFESNHFFGVRAYVPGDRMSRIHWPASARSNLLHAKDFELAVSNDVLVIPDFSAASFAGARDPLLELTVTITASLLRTLSESGKTFQLILGGRQAVTLPPGTGSAHLMRAFDLLTAVEPDGPVAFSHHLAQSCQRHGQSSARLIISPLLTVETATLAATACAGSPIDWFMPIRPTDPDPNAPAMDRLLASGVGLYVLDSPERLGSLRKEGAHRAATP